jgi:hypothetical protein
MNAKQRTSFTGAMMRHWVIACFAIAITTVKLSAADELVRIDFRNRIPGIVDAPVFDFDRASGLQDSFWAALYVGPDTNSFLPQDAPYPFLTGTNAGYWQHDTPLEIVPHPEPSLGQRIWFQVRILQVVPVGPFGESIDVGRSGIHSMVVTNYVMPMVGLQSFSLQPEQLHITRQADQIVVQWQYLAAHRYELQSTGNLLA